MIEYIIALIKFQNVTQMDEKFQMNVLILS